MMLLPKTKIVKLKKILYYPFMRKALAKIRKIIVDDEKTFASTSIHIDYKHTKTSLNEKLASKVFRGVQSNLEKYVTKS